MTGDDLAKKVEKTLNFLDSEGRYCVYRGNEAVEMVDGQPTGHIYGLIVGNYRGAVDIELVSALIVNQLLIAGLEVYKGNENLAEFYLIKDEHRSCVHRLISYCFPRFDGAGVALYVDGLVPNKYCLKDGVVVEITGGLLWDRQYRPVERIKEIDLSEWKK